MKKALLTLFAGIMAVSASAANQYESTPANGSTINLDENSGGVSSIEINCTGEINRNCTTGFATLSKGSTVLKAIPASNIRMVYCVDGFDKVTKGTPHITFFEKASTSPGIEPGNYTVTIPSNFFTVNGVGNSQLIYHYTIPGDNIKVKVSPEKNSSVSALKEVSVTIEGAETVSCTNAGGAKYYYTDPTNDEKLLEGAATDVAVSGNTVTFTFPEYSTPGAVSVDITAGTIKYTMPGQSGTKSLGSQEFTLTIAPTLGDADFKMNPATGTYTGTFKPLKTEEIPSEYEGQAPTIKNTYFELTAPEGSKFGLFQGRRTCIYAEQADGTLKATSNYFTSWALSDDKTTAAALLNGESNRELKLAPGTYYLVIPAKTFNIFAPGAETAALYDKELKFGPYIVEGEPVKYTVTPDEEVTEISEIVITFPEGSDIVVNKIGWFTLMDGAIEYDFRGEAKDNTVVITVNPPMTTTGEYQLISEGSNIRVNDMETPVSATFTVIRSFITEINLLSNGEAVEAKVEDDEDYGSIWTATVKTADAETTTADVTFEAPFGYDSVYAMVYNVSADALRRVPVAELEASGMKKLENNTLSNLEVGQHLVAFTYVADGQGLEPAMMKLTVKQNEISGVENVDAAEEAEYFTLQGVKVVNPEKGIYIKVANGKATKVNVK